MYEVIMN